MRVCFITSEVFVGRHGGFGRLVRVVGRELARRGFDVYAITWAEPGMEGFMEIDSVKVLSYPYSYTTSSALRHVIDYSRVVPLIRQVNADVYISIDCMVETYIAQKVMPRRRHVIWVQDPFDENDYRLLSLVDPNYKFNKPKFEATRLLYALAYRRADLVLTQARYYIPKIRRLYHIDPEKIVYMPNPVEYIPVESSIVKSEKPIVCYLGRMDPQKRYWLFFELARKFPDIEFIAMGAPNQLYKELYNRIIRKYQGLRNLKVLGFVSEGKKREILSKCWILCLPSIREGLPIAFLEALAHKCALLSTVNPDNIVEMFGYYGEVKDLSKRLEALLKDNEWKIKGELGYRYVVEVHSLHKVIDKLIDVLQSCSVLGKVTNDFYA